MADLKHFKEQLEGSDFWKKKANLREYVTTQWLKCEHRWVKCFRNPLVDRCVSTNNGVEALNKIHTTQLSEITITQHNTTQLSEILL